MAKEARDLEAFAIQMDRPDLAADAAALAQKFDDEGFSGIIVRTPKIELPTGVRREALRGETLQKGEFAGAFEQKGIHVSRPYAQDIIDRMEVSAKRPDVELVWPSGRDLGLRQAVPYRRFLEVGQAAGLNILRPEVGLYLRLQDTDQPLGDMYWIAMEPIVDRRGSPIVFALGHDDRGLWLYADWVYPGVGWDPGGRLAFGLCE